MLPTDQINVTTYDSLGKLIEDSFVYVSPITYQFLTTSTVSSLTDFQLNFNLDAPLPQSYEMIIQFPKSDIRINRELVSRVIGTGMFDPLDENTLVSSKFVSV